MRCNDTGVSKMEGSLCCLPLLTLTHVLMMPCLAVDDEVHSLLRRGPGSHGACAWKALLIVTQILLRIPGAA
jgi:hypothetical protein